MRSGTGCRPWYLYDGNLIFGLPPVPRQQNHRRHFRGWKQPTAEVREIYECRWRELFKYIQGGGPTIVAGAEKGQCTEHEIPRGYCPAFFA
jgi:hypothetical protein